MNILFITQGELKVQSLFRGGERRRSRTKPSESRRGRDEEEKRSKPASQMFLCDKTYSNPAEEKTGPRQIHKETARDQAVALAFSIFITPRSIEIVRKCFRGQT